LNKLAIVVIVIVVAIGVSLSAYYYGVMGRGHKAQTNQLSFKYPGYLPTSEIDKDLGGNWAIIGNESGYISINHSNSSVTIAYVNGTKSTKPASSYPNIYNNNFYNHTLFESVTIYYQVGNKSNKILVQVLKSDPSGSKYLNDDIVTVSKIYNKPINKIGNTSYIVIRNSLIASHNNYLIILATSSNYGSKIVELLNLTVETLR